MSDHQRCVAKLGEPYRMTECGAPCEFLTAGQARAEGRGYSGWYHVDRTLTAGHHAVPASLL
jgi:hypothetical protein